MQSLTFNSDSPERTQLLGSYLGQLAQRANVFLLTGELGTGKTCLTQGIARGLNVKEFASSPSFVILRQYHGRLPLYHLDFYRLDHVDEIADLGLEELFYGDGVCVVEWAEKALHLVPRDNLLVVIDYAPNSRNGRSICLYPQGKHYNQLLEQLENEHELWANMQSVTPYRNPGAKSCRTK